MLAESDVMTAVLLRLTETDVPAPPAHDPLVLPKRQLAEVRRAMEEEFLRCTGHPIAVW